VGWNKYHVFVGQIRPRATRPGSIAKKKGHRATVTFHSHLQTPTNPSHRPPTPQGNLGDDLLPNEIFGFSNPVLVKSGYEHTLVTGPPQNADFFQYDDFSGVNADFVHYGDSSQPIAPDSACPRCVPWEQAPQPAGAQPRLAGRQCSNPPWSIGAGVVAANTWCFVAQAVAQVGRALARARQPRLARARAPRVRSRCAAIKMGGWAGTAPVTA
jgi:hypothetical protein